MGHTNTLYLLRDSKGRKGKSYIGAPKKNSPPLGPTQNYRQLFPKSGGKENFKMATLRIEPASKANVQTQKLCYQEQGLANPKESVENWEKKESHQAN